MAATDVDRRLGRRVKELREQRGLSQERLAEAVGRSVDTISNLERGASSTRLKTVADIAHALGVEISVLFWPDSGSPPELPERFHSLFAVIAEQPAAVIDAVREAARLIVRVHDQAAGK